MERVADGKVRIEDPMGEIKQLGGENAESMRAAEPAQPAKPVEPRMESANERAAEMQKPAVAAPADGAEAQAKADAQKAAA